MPQRKAKSGILWAIMRSLRIRKLPIGIGHLFGILPGFLLILGGYFRIA